MSGTGRSTERPRLAVRDVVDRLLGPAGLSEDTVDGLVEGDPDAEVTGIVTAFMPTVHVLERAIRLGANVIIAHEGPYYQHRRDLEEAYRGSPVIAAKRKLIADARLSLVRCHDEWHRYPQDGVMLGLIQALDWADRMRELGPAYAVAEIPAASASEVAQEVKRKLDVPFVRLAGDAEAVCRRVGLLVGYRGGGQHAIPLLERERLDLLLYGEGPEWETPEYVRDAARLGRAKAALVLGHAESEEPGMRLLADRLRRLFPHVPVHYIKEQPVFQWI